MLTTGPEAGAPSGEPGLVGRMLRVEWLGQTVASGCWICSVLAYGTTSTGDWLQLAAASAWMVANLASLSPRVDGL